MLLLNSSQLLCFEQHVALIISDKNVVFVIISIPDYKNLVVLQRIYVCLVLEKDVCFPEIKGLEGIFEIEGIFRLAGTWRFLGTRAIFGKEEKFFKIAGGL
jgi:hypothetical protein